jgi:thioredoxin-dependent peroxiredoxin
MDIRSGFVAILLSVSCATPAPQPPEEPSQVVNFEVVTESAKPGTTVKAGGVVAKLYPGDIAVGKPIRKYFAALGEMPSGVAVINVVPSIDTKVCEKQSHLLGETTVLNPTVQRITVSRDLPFAQNRFASEAKLTNIKYFSDYKEGKFGRSSGLMMKGSELLARAVIVSDDKGIIRYLQVVPDVARLPDLERAFAVANDLVAKSK